jgi:hypothetical protein
MKFLIPHLNCKSVNHVFGTEMQRLGIFRQETVSDRTHKTFSVIAKTSSLTNIELLMSYLSNANF